MSSWRTETQPHREKTGVQRQLVVCEFQKIAAHVKKVQKFWVRAKLVLPGSQQGLTEESKENKSSHHQECPPASSNGWLLKPFSKVGLHHGVKWYSLKFSSQLSQFAFLISNSIPESSGKICVFFFYFFNSSWWTQRWTRPGMTKILSESFQLLIRSKKCHSFFWDTFS